MRQLAKVLMLGAVLTACGGGGGGGGGGVPPPCQGGGCVVAIAANNSDETSCALLASGGVRCWGGNYYGQLGTDAILVASTAAYSTTPVPASLSGATALSVGDANGCVVAAGGTVQCWGANFNDQLGTDTVDFQAAPRQLQGLSGVQAVATGGTFACALLGPAAVRCWGGNALGQLGNGGTTTSMDPVSVGTLEGISAIAAGVSHACALVTGGALRCWGDNSRGELGNPEIGAYSADPVPAATTITGATAIALGYRATCAVVQGAVKCWGSNFYGQLGAPAASFSVDPVTVASVSDATAISLGYDHACAIVAGGKVKCWGWNGEGQLGNGGTSGAIANGIGWLAEEVVGITGATAITVGEAHTCALIAGSGVKCWGQNTSGQLGDGTRTERHAPVDVLF